MILLMFSNAFVFWLSRCFLLLIMLLSPSFELSRPYGDLWLTWTTFIASVGVGAGYLSRKKCIGLTFSRCSSSCYLIMALLDIFLLQAALASSWPSPSLSTKSFTMKPWYWSFFYCSFCFFSSGSTGFVLSYFSISSSWSSSESVKWSSSVSLADLRVFFFFFFMRLARAYSLFFLICSLI